MDMPQINYLAVLVAALSSFVIGFLWYAPFSFGTVWMKEVGLTEEKISQTSMFKTFGLTFVLSLLFVLILLPLWVLKMGWPGE